MHGYVGVVALVEEALLHVPAAGAAALAAVDGLEVVDRLQLRPVRLPVQPEQQRRADDGDRAERHCRRPHPRLQLQAQRGEDPRGHGDADLGKKTAFCKTIIQCAPRQLPFATHQVIRGREDEVEPDPVDGLLGQVETAYDVQEVVLE